MKWKSEWASGQRYEPGDLVRWISAVFICVEAHEASEDNRPQWMGPSDSECWDVFVADGQAGPAGVDAPRGD